MRIAMYLLAALVLGIFFAALRGMTASESSAGNPSSGSQHPKLDYLKAVNSVGPPRDPQLLFLLMGQYANANLQGEGAEFFLARMKEFEPRRTDAQKALYLSTVGLLRVQHASSVSLLQRAGYVKDTMASGK